MNNRPFAEQNPANLINRRSPWQSDDIFFLIWRDGKPFCRFRFRDQLAVMFENHLWRVARLQRDLGRILDRRQPIRNETVTQSVPLPLKFLDVLEVMRRFPLRAFRAPRSRLEPASQFVWPCSRILSHARRFVRAA